MALMQETARILGAMYQEQQTKTKYIFLIINNNITLFLALFIPFCRYIFPSGIIFLFHEALLIFLIVQVCQ